MNEKLKILKMLESGQITANEASALLSAADSPSSTPPPSSQRQQQPSGRPHSTSDKAPASRTLSLSDDIGRKFEGFARDMGPKVQRFTESMADKILAAADKVGQTFAAPPTSSQSTHTHRAPAKAGTKNESQVELPVDVSAHNELSISGINGKISITGYNGDKITARLAYRRKRHGANIDLVKLGGKFYLQYEPDDFDVVSIDAFVPERAFNAVRIDGINSQIDISTIIADDIAIQGANGDMRLGGLHATRLSAENTGGVLDAKNLSANEAKIENMSGAMNLSELDIENLQLQNFNAPMSLVMSQFARYTRYTWAVETSNAKLGINLPTIRDLGYHIKAHAAMSEIRLTLVSMNYLINEPSLVEAKSTWIDAAAKRLNLRAETSGGVLIIS